MKGFIENILTEQTVYSDQAVVETRITCLSMLTPVPAFRRYHPVVTPRIAACKAPFCRSPRLSVPGKGTSAADSVDLSSASCERDVR